MRVTSNDTLPNAYFLLDLAWYRDGIRHLFEIEPAPHYALLYLQTTQASAAEHGPLLISPSLTETRETLRRRAEQELAIELLSRWKLDDIAHHLRTLTMAQRDNGASVVLRYADPRLYAAIIPSLSETDQTRLLGPIESMSGVAANRPWTLRQAPEAAVRHVPTDEPFRLTHCHELNQQAWRESALLQPLATRHDAPLERLIGWFRELRTMGFGTESDCLEACRRLACLGIDRPIGEPTRTALQAHPGSLDARLAALAAHVSSASPTQEMVHG